MKRYSSAPCLEDAGGDVKRTRGIEDYADLNTKEYLQLALNRILELQQEIKEGTYVEETDNDTSDPDTSGSEDVTKQIVTKVFRDLPGTSNLFAIIDRETLWNRRIDALHSKRIQLLGFDTCRRLALDFMKNVVHESRNRSSSLDRAEFDRFPENRSYSRDDEILANDLRKRESKAQEIRARMLKSLDLHLAVKQRDYTVKLMRSNI
ncbi:uncharacterized protein LOC109859753 [Pseudomyrmex gracilis]|uniref:uncharacterized protein LOC109859753 n=1 Tax=Pseudomyrmex gracilis TaxID=219809 RepID=UPI000995A355|nr:uncharacterized protein LOC109859753 [Pseudomyrmex gracilis]